MLSSIVLNIKCGGEKSIELFTYVLWKPGLHRSFKQEGNFTQTDVVYENRKITLGLIRRF